MELRLENNDYVIYVLQRGNEVSVKMNKEPDGWIEDDLELIRHKKYHGILTQFTGGLKFYGAEKDFIEEAYKLYGINANLYLIRYVLRPEKHYVKGRFVSFDRFDKVKYVQQYRGLADFETKKDKDGAIEINFNSQELDLLLQSYESDDLAIERTTDLENNRISNIPFNKVEILGRDLQGTGWAENTLPVIAEAQSAAGTGYEPRFSIPTEFGVKGFGRHVEVTDVLYDTGSRLSHQSKFFYNDVEESVMLESKLEVTISFRIKVGLFRKEGNVPTIIPTIRVYNFNASEEVYDYVFEAWAGQSFPIDEWVEFNDVVVNFDWRNLKNTNALTMAFEAVGWEPPPQNVSFQVTCEIENFRIDVKETTRYRPDDRIHEFSFVNEVGSRLAEIITGNKKRFYSKVFGRAGEMLSTQYQDYQYTEDGEWGHIGLIHGFDIRKFKKDNPLYKSMEVSMKTIMDSLMATFNIGVGIEDSKLGERLRFEKVNHFYQGRKIVQLHQQITNVERTVDAKLFNSSGSFGSDKGGDYEFGLGLDEPNVKTDYIFPLRKTKNKYVQISKIRSDDTGMELIRREPEYLDATRDMSGDDDIWYLDLKEGRDSDIYQQLDWNDALAFEPIGIISPETYRSWRFTPKRSMFRHGKILRAGMEQEYTLEKYISLGSSDSNINLQTKYLPDVAPGEKKGIVGEGNPEKARRLDNALILPEIIKFNHPIDENLMRWLLGTTPVMIGGEIEEVPNWYFKIGFINEKEEMESGYIVSLKPKKGAFEVYKSNEKMLGFEEDAEDVLAFSMEVGFLKFTNFKVGGTGFIRWNDGTPDTFYNGPEIEVMHYSDNFVGTIEFYGTLTLLKIEDTTANFTHDLSDLPEEIIYYQNNSLNTVTGKISDLPRNISVFYIQGLTTIFGDASDFPSGLVQLSLGGLSTVTGNISTAPNISQVVIWMMKGKNTVNGYNAGTTFHPEIYVFDHLPTEGNGLSTIEVDNILIDLYNSGMSWGSIDLRGNNNSRSNVSDQAVLDLEARGVIVNTN